MKIRHCGILTMLDPETGKMAQATFTNGEPESKNYRELVIVQDPALDPNGTTTTPKTVMYNAMSAVDRRLNNHYDLSLDRVEYYTDSGELISLSVFILESVKHEDGGSMEWPEDLVKPELHSGNPTFRFTSKLRNDTQIPHVTGPDFDTNGYTSLHPLASLETILALQYFQACTSETTLTDVRPRLRLAHLLAKQLGNAVGYTDKVIASNNGGVYGDASAAKELVIKIVKTEHPPQQVNIDHHPLGLSASPTAVLAMVDWINYGVIDQVKLDETNNILELIEPEDIYVGRYDALDAGDMLVIRTPKSPNTYMVISFRSPLLGTELNAY